MSINFAVSTGPFSTSLAFTDPVRLDRCFPLKQAGLYAVLLYDIAQKPQPFKVIYFGHTEDYTTRGFAGAHHKYQDWHKCCKPGESLYIAFYAMPNSTEQRRKNLESQLIQAYEPICNEVGINPFRRSMVRGF